MAKNTYYIHSTGIIKGPNTADGKHGVKNQARADLFSSKRAALKARQQMEMAIKSERIKERFYKRWLRF